MGVPTDELISLRFGEARQVSSIKGNLQWVLTRHEYYGATNRIILNKDANLLAPSYLLEVETESGYGFTMTLGRYNEEEVEMLVQGFRPTSPTFKMD